MKRLTDSELVKRLTSIQHDDVAATEFEIAGRLVGFPGIHKPLLPGSVEYGLRLGAGWPKKAVIRYGGKFWDIEKYAGRANRERDEKLPDWFNRVTGEQKMNWHDRFGELVRMAAAKAAENILRGVCDVWDADVGELRENDWDFPILMPKREPL